MSDEAKPPNVFFRLALGSGVLFVLTVLALTASVFGDQRSPPARFLADHGGAVIAAEVAATLVFGFWAMALDRVRTLRDNAARDGQSSRDSGLSAEEKG